MTGEPMVLLSDPRIAAIDLFDNGESLVDVREVTELQVDNRHAGTIDAFAHLREGFAHLREGMVQRLLDAQATLPDGLRLLIVEGYRQLETQRSVFDGYRDELRSLHPDWDADRLFVETSKFASPVEVAPHSTGGAIDLTLCTDEGIELDMGTCIDATPEASDNACFTAATNVSERAQHNRRTLTRALAGAGLVNYPTEWWHWSFGDRYWAYVTGTGRSHYGPALLTGTTETNATGAKEECA